MSEFRYIEPEPDPELEREPLPWLDVWGNAITSPTVETYEEIISDPQASNFRSYLWIGLSTLLSTILTTILGLMLGSNSVPQLPGNMQTPEITSLLVGASAISLLCMIPVTLVVSIIGFIIYIGILNFLATIFGGKGSFRELAAAISAYTTPLTIFLSIINAIPFVNLISLPLGLYSLFLNFLAIKSVYRFGWGRAILTSLIIPILFGILVVVLFAGVISALGPSFFENLLHQFNSFMR